jgi:uncharacterized membrane protein
METPLSPVSAQEKLSASLGSIVFFLPLLMGVKTDYVTRYMKQGFAINIIQVLCSVISMFLWFLSPLLGLVSFIFFLFSLFLAFQAYSGKVYTASPLLENGEKIIKTLGISNLFVPGK